MSIYVNGVELTQGDEATHLAIKALLATKQRPDDSDNLEVAFRVNGTPVDWFDFTNRILDMFEQSTAEKAEAFMRAKRSAVTEQVDRILDRLTRLADEAEDPVQDHSPAGLVRQIREAISQIGASGISQADFKEQAGVELDLLPARFQRDLMGLCPDTAVRCLYGNHTSQEFRHLADATSWLTDRSNRDTLDYFSVRNIEMVSYRGQNLHKPLDITPDLWADRIVTWLASVDSALKGAGRG